jgi:hypothetical protein
MPCLCRWPSFSNERPKTSTTQRKSLLWHNGPTNRPQLLCGIQ